MFRGFLKVIWGGFLGVPLKGCFRMDQTSFTSLCFPMCGDKAAEWPPIDNIFSTGHGGPIAHLDHALDDILV